MGHFFSFLHCLDPRLVAVQATGRCVMALGKTQLQMCPEYSSLVGLTGHAQDQGLGLGEEG